MKVLEEIVDYLARRGVLADGEIEALEASGFIRTRAERDLDGGFYDYDYDYDYDDYGDPWDHAGDYALPRQQPPLRTVRRGRRGSVLKAPLIAARLRAFLASADPMLGALSLVVPEPAPADRWARIAAIGRSDPASLGPSLRAAIDGGSASFRLLWDALGAQGYLSAVGPGEHGPAASAYRAIMAAREHRDMGKHAWLLGRRAVARTYDLSRAQDRLAEAFFAIARTSPDLTGKWLSRQYHPVAYWALVLHYNASRLAMGAPWEARSGEQPARRRLPDREGLSMAWSLALLHGDRSHRSGLRSLWEVANLRAVDAPDAPDAPEASRPHVLLFCPGGWN